MTTSHQFGESSGYGISGMVLGIFCTLHAVTPGMYLFAGICGILGMIFSGARIDYQRGAGGAPDATAIIGAVFSVVGLSITVISLINLIKMFP